ncbi:MAG: metallophosphoesterase [Faecalibacterium prausnitzii]
MKQLISRRSFLKAAGVTAAAASMAIGAPAASACWYGDKSDVTILYTNDVHTYIDKQSPKLTYAAIADLKQSYQNAGKDVLLVDAGDHVQGTAYGSMDEGASIIKLMNAAGYDVATPGNHEFDYGMDRAKAIMKEADFPYLSCNWVDLRTDAACAALRQGVRARRQTHCLCGRDHPRDLHQVHPGLLYG